MPSNGSVVVPIGQYLGPAESRESPSGRLHRIDDGVNTHALTDAEYTAWRSAAGVALDGWDRRRAISAARRAGVKRARRVIDGLIRGKLIWEIDVLSNDLILFAGLHRVAARMHVLGPSADAPGVFEVGIPQVVHAPVSEDSLNIYLYAPTFDDLWSACVAVADVTPTEQHPNWPKEHMLATAFVAESGPLVASGAASYLRAHPELGAYS